MLPGLFYPASRTVQKFIFKTETHKLTLHIKGMYLFFLQETVQSICLTLSLVYQTNHLNYCKAGWNDFLEITWVLRKASVLLKAQKEGGMESHPTCRAAAEAWLPRANHSFLKDPTGTRAALCSVCCRVKTCIQKHASVWHCHSMPAWLRNQQHAGTQP